jgi:plasmid stabilization system protein ParE
VSAILDHLDGILVFPLAGRARDDVRPGMRTSTFKKKTLVAYEVDESSGDLVATSSASSTVARTGRPRSAKTRAIRRRAGDALVGGKCW